MKVVARINVELEPCPCFGKGLEYDVLHIDFEAEKVTLVAPLFTYSLLPSGQAKKFRTMQKTIILKTKDVTFREVEL